MSLAGALSPKNFQVFIKTESTAGTSVLATTGMDALDVDSVGFPSLNTTIVTEVRTSAVSLFQSADFFSENTQRVTEISLSGVLKNDDGHKVLLSNITNNTGTPYAVPSATYSGYSGLYGTTSSANNKTFTLAIKSADHTDGDSIVMSGCVCTNFTFSADSGTEGGRYKWSATVQSGKKPVVNEHGTLAGADAYGSTDISLPNATVKKINDTTIVMQSFSVAIDSAAVFSGVSTTGYETVSRGQELAVTADATVKYDSTNRGWVDTYDSGVLMTTNSFLLTNGTDYSTTIKNAVFTDVSWNEGDTMMLNASLKATASSTDDLISIIVS